MVEEKVDLRVAVPRGALDGKKEVIDIETVTTILIGERTKRDWRTFPAKKVVDFDEEQHHLAYHLLLLYGACGVFEECYNQYQQMVFFFHIMNSYQKQKKTKMTAKKKIKKTIFFHPPRKAEASIVFSVLKSSLVVLGS